METKMNCIAILSRSYYAYFMSTFACNGLIIVVADSEADPITVRIEISLNRTNRVRVVQFKRYLLVAAIPTSGKKVITEEKGGPQINYKELLALVPQARVLHPEEFQKILNHMKNRT